MFVLRILCEIQGGRKTVPYSEVYTSCMWWCKKALHI